MIFCSTNDDLNAIDKTSNLHNCKSLLNKNIAVNENKTERGGRVFFPFWKIADDLYKIYKWFNILSVG